MPAPPRGSRGAYSTDASNFRQVPIGVVVPRTPEAAAVAVAVCRAHGVPVLSRGGGTSLAGQCTNTAVVLDWTKYCHRVLSVDPQQRTCTVEPGIVLDQLNASLAPVGLRFGPEPATHMNCTLGGPWPSRSSSPGSATPTPPPWLASQLSAGVQRWPAGWMNGGPAG